MLCQGQDLGPALFFVPFQEAVGWCVAGAQTAGVFRFATLQGGLHLCEGGWG